MDDDGYLQIVGRIKDMIIRGGINVDPAEIENFLLAHPDIADVAVVGVPDPEYGEHVLACIRPVPGASVTEDDVRAYCDGRIAYFKVPYYIQFVDAFPMTVSGKIQKFKIREQAISELGLAV
jgi:fatty-acyl-CoA synthase